jgi:hypothetical protein
MEVIRLTTIANPDTTARGGKPDSDLSASRRNEIYEETKQRQRPREKEDS